MRTHKMLAMAVVLTALLAAPLLTRSASAARIATTGRPQSPAIAFSPRANSYVLVWAEDRGMGTGLDLYSARVTKTGIVAGGALPLVVASGNQSQPALAWSEHNSSFLLVFASDGAPFASPTPPVPIPGTAGPQPFPTPPGPPLPLGNLPLASRAGRLESTASNARDGLAEPLSAAVEPVPGPLQPTFPPPPPPPPVTPGPSPTQPSGQTPPPTPVATPATPPGPIPPPPVVPGSRDIYGTWVADSGMRLTDVFPVLASPADETFPSLGYRYSSRYDYWALVWREVTGTDVSIVSMELTGFAQGLAVTSGKNIVVSGADQGRPSVAIEYSGEGLVVWSETPQGKATRDVFARSLNLNMYPIGPIRKIATDPNDQVYPSVAALGASGGYIVTWEERATGQPPDIRLRRLNMNGVAMRYIYNVAAGPPFSFSPCLPSTSQPTRLLVWVDRNAASDQSILAAEVNRDGRRTGPERTLVQGGTGPSAVTPVLPPTVFPTMPPVPPFPTP